MKTTAMVITLASFSLSGCVFDDFVSSVQTSFAGAPTPVVVAQIDPVTLAGPNAIPWQLTPASTASVAQGETTIVVDKPGVGRIRGTETALAKLGERIVPFSDATPVVSACKDAFDPQAKKEGAYSVEAAAAGPEKRTVKGRTQQVFFRIFYADPKDQGVEVRQAAIACTVGRKGQLLEASVV